MQLNQKLFLTPSVFIQCVSIRPSWPCISVSYKTFVLKDMTVKALDSDSSETVMGLLKDLNVAGKTVIVITHDSIVANKCKHIIRLTDGKIV